MTGLDDEALRATELLEGKAVKQVWRNSKAEVGLEFTDGTRLLVDSKDNEVELSITNGETPGSTDWASLLEPYKDGAVSETDGKDLLAALLGPDAIEEAVNFYFNSTTPQTEALRMLFSVLESAVATKKCLAVLWSDGSPRHKERATDLLPVLCRPSNLVDVESLLADSDLGRQLAAARILFQLRWSIDLDTDQVARIVRRCQQIVHPALHGISLDLASGALQAMLDHGDEPAEGEDRLSSDEIEGLFLRALQSPHPAQQEDGLHHFPLSLRARLRPQLESLLSDHDSYAAELAQQIIDDQI